MDGTLLAILILLLFATVLALIQTRRRDRCLKSFAGFHATLAEKDGDLTWGTLEVHPSGLEVNYDEPVIAREGHLERSFIFYKDQYDTMDVLYRYPGGLSEEEKERRAAVIAQTAEPSLMRRLGRTLRNWIGMVRDALMQSVSMIIGVAKATRPGATVLNQQEQHLKALSGEVIGQAGNAFDPLLERHLFRQVVLEVTRGGRTRNFCGWLKDYTAQFIELVDAYANTQEARMPLRACSPGEAHEKVQVTVEENKVRITNMGERVLNVRRLETADWERSIGCVLPPEFTADFPLPPGTEPDSVCAYVGTVDRIDLVVPRAHAIVRHAADGSEERLQDAAEPPSVMAQAARRAAVAQDGGEGG